ncbi:MAG: LytTR family transcriptional regulator [Clostridia bacterium]|nr:LytTR family transcriptional regulator [Clostridia bacterium]
MKFKLILDDKNEESVVVTARRKSELTDQIESLVMKYSGDDVIAAYTEDEQLMLKFSQIECVTVIDGKTYAIDTKGERFRIKLRLNEAEQRLPSVFIRINKSTLANEKRIERFKATYSGGVDAIFKCGYREYVSRRCFADIKRRFREK